MILIKIYITIIYYNKMHIFLLYMFQYITYLLSVTIILANPVTTAFDKDEFKLTGPSP